MRALKCVRVWTEFTGSGQDSCDHGNEPADSEHSRLSAPRGAGSCTESVSQVAQCTWHEPLLEHATWQTANSPKRHALLAGKPLVDLFKALFQVRKLRSVE
jgi:hypothetical protein